MSAREQPAAAGSSRAPVVGPGGLGTLACVVLIGVGVIGTYLVSHLARLRGLERLILVDPDAFDERNLGCQEIDAGDVGRAKVDVAARRARRIRPGLDVERLRSTVEALPAGALRADVVLSATDSLASRRAVADRVWPLGIPWIDAGVQGEASLARVTAYLPGDGRPCIECGWDERHYTASSRQRSCAQRAAAQDNGQRVEAPPTGAGSGLGALAAALAAQVLEEARGYREVFGREVIIDLAHHHAYTSKLQRQPECRRPGHSVWEIERLDGARDGLRLGELLDLGAQRSTQGSRWIEVLGASFVGALSCVDCGATGKRLWLEPALGLAARRCRRCGGRRVPVAFRRSDRLIEAELPSSVLRRKLSRLGLRRGDVVSIGRERRERERHFELG